jgi:ornithine cyclodeaminase
MIRFTYLSGPDVEALAMTDEETLAAVEGALAAQGRGETVIGPRAHLVPDPAFRGHFNVLRGYVAPLGVAGVKVVGDYVDYYRHGLPSEMALLALFDPRTGMPRALLDATAITDMRTGAVTALGARYLARRGPAVGGDPSRGAGRDRGGPEAGARARCNGPTGRRPTSAPRCRPERWPPSTPPRPTGQG